MKEIIRVACMEKYPYQPSSQKSFWTNVLFLILNFLVSLEIFPESCPFNKSDEPKRLNT
jgi:hypothetical protein